MLPLTRRDFLATTSLAFAQTIYGARAMHARRLPRHIARSGVTGASLLPPLVDAADIRMLATSGLDAATSAGAAYADIRIAERHELALFLATEMMVAPDTSLQSTFDYGIRVLVDGTWGCVHGTAPSRDAIAAAARHAVSMARSYAPYTMRRVELAPTARAVGEWSTPVQIDPFAVPLEDQSALFHAYQAASLRVRRGASRIGGTGARWIRETRVCASSDGTLTTQHLSRSMPLVGGFGNDGMGWVQLSIPSLFAASGGYERLIQPSVQDEIKEITEEAGRLASLPRRAMEVGRYPIVFDGRTFGAALGQTLGAALELDRALDYDADASGTSFLAPPHDVLGTQIASSALTVAGHRTVPAFNAVKWDDEGVEPQSFPVITQGQLIDYGTSRETAPSLRTIYERRGESVRSRGCAVAIQASAPVLVGMPHLTVTPNAGAATLEHLYRDMGHGIVALDIETFSTDQRLSSGTWLFSGALFEVERGKMVRRLHTNGLQFRVSKLWNGLVTCGDASTIRESTVRTFKGHPYQTMVNGVTAPAGSFKEIDVISTKLGA